ncbi:MAG: hypothetical protein IT429_10875 [Gemmataceae bacterium]|nr:hypothetical protein [Gemmataceae bacterium]
MNSVKEIIELTGGWELLAQRPVTVRVEGFMALCIQVVGRGPLGGTLLSVAHYQEQGGNVCRDPELVVEIGPDSGDWVPVSYLQDGLRLFREVITTDGGTVLFNHRLVAELRGFMAEWDRNIREQGFVEAVRKPA